MTTAAAAGPDHANAAALGLIEALVQEARSWACDDEEDSATLDALDSADPDGQLDILSDATLAPRHLVAAVVEAVRVLAPRLLT
ncbi:hypothetical protein ACFXPX_38530 [Kitasatospora sp. NPDC059146]|uniref:hypothetical protein n=1 Tax=unclassified Kitasatospora TaxID=2633591 RepID=UPI0036C90098